MIPSNNPERPPLLAIPPAQIQKPNRRWPVVLVWCIVAAIAGLSCVVLPPYLIEGAIKHPQYGWPLIPWFATATANLRPLPTMVLLFALGIAVGVAQPRSWLLLGCAAVSLTPVLTVINMIHDWTIDATSHNLFPFEFAILAFISSPALLGAFLGSRLRRTKVTQSNQQ